MMKRKLTLTTLILAAGLPMAAMAQGAGGGTYQDATKPTPHTTAPTPKDTPDGPAGAGMAPAGGDTSAMFKDLDRDKDGQVSKEEAKRSADVEKRFDTLDANHDGKVSMSEWSSGKMK
jgi:hypothetical protein